MGGDRLHEWAFATRTFRQMQGLDGGDRGLDDEARRHAVGGARTLRAERTELVRPVARSYGHRASAVARPGRPPRARVMDLLFAATAHAHDAALLTRNADDLECIEPLVEIALL